MSHVFNKMAAEFEALLVENSYAKSPKKKTSRFDFTFQEEPTEKHRQSSDDMWKNAATKVLLN